MRPGLDSQPRGATGGLPPGTDPFCLWITTVAVVAGLVAGLAAGRPDSAAPGASPRPLAGSAGRLALPAAGAPAARGPRHNAGLRLLAGAATACQTLTFRGLQVVAWWGPGGGSAATVDVWHRRGAAELSQAAATAPGWPAGTRRLSPSQPAGLVPPAAMDMSPRQVSLLAANYQVAAGRPGRVAGRPARIVTVRRPDGTLAARFWLDRATRLPLRRKVYAATGRLVSADAYVRLQVGRSAGAGVPAAGARQWPRGLASAQLALLRGRGWPLPGPLPGHLTLIDARETGDRSGPVVHLAYSDGLSLVSVFIQRGHLAPALAGWRAAMLDGHRVYADDPDDLSVAWSARGFVYTLISQAPDGTVGRVVGALPHGAAARPPGVLGRLRLGAGRLLSWLTPR